MTTTQLQNFLVLTETLNFRKASERIFIAQPALSRQIQVLEEEIGFLLFDRSRKQIALTKSGIFFKAEVSKILNQLDQSIKRGVLINQGKAGEIKIGHASSAMHTVLPELLRYMETNMPDLKSSLVEGTNEMIFDKLNDNEVDFGFVPNAFIPDGVSSLSIYKENYLLILPEDHRLNTSNFKDLADCKNEKWVLNPHPEGVGYMEEILKIIGNYGYSPKIVHRSPNTSTVLRMVSAGLGITMMGKSTLKGFSLDLKSIELSDLPYQLDMKLVWKTERENELESYLNFLKNYLKI
ncbi:LysR family transcriptional regulator [Winogradskyella bathintestinalis]|uniref:LysR family transcriptional regulator n=1 Tax=Winogradskyella bathintestinalis TaxID=3035208 RepID=A0ABT7ZZD2_9FLAO|nr:LysR family transcriptional regulator [Winogradskyella bathintestinalis]MDN3494246.1 LysR family transcriptional regulator [Winogradskyella bathintestinalis]